MSDNLYQTAPDDDRLAPFAGRQAELSRLDHYLKQPSSSHALVFLGGRWMGKTALLRRFDSVFHDPYIGAYLPLGNVTLRREADLFRAMVEGITYYLTLRDYTASRIPVLETEPADWRDWLTKTWLPEISRIIRPHRKLVLLFDDAHHWLRAEEDSFAFFHSLLLAQPQFKLVMSITGAAEDRLGSMSPLVDPGHVLRLTNLDLESCRWLLQSPPAGRYTVPEDSATIIYRATGGHPQLTQRFAWHIHNYHTTHSDQNIITPAIIQSLTTVVYAYSDGEMATLWAESSDNEQLILTAVSDLRYNDPLATLNAARIGEWLADSDYPLDITAVNAALRSLEYRELLVHRDDNIRLTSDLMHMWLLDHARHNPVQPAASANSNLRRRPTRLIAGVLAVIVIVVLIISLSATPQPTSNDPDLAPTVTLAGQ